MNLYFGKQRCKHCGCGYDAKVSKCPKCGEISVNSRLNSQFNHQIHISYTKELALFFIGLLGKSIIGIIVAFIMQMVYVSNYGKETLQLYVESTEYMVVANSISFFATAIIMALVVLKERKQFGRSFATIFVLVGIGALVANVVGSLINNAIVLGIFNAIGQTPPSGDSKNQLDVIKMIRMNPALIFFVVVLLAPFVEELTYRVGLFNFTSRFGKPIAYIASMLVFMSIHIDWDIIFSGIRGEELLNEIISMPSYLLGGLVLTLAYDFGGFGAAFLAHVTINAISYFQILGSQAGLVQVTRIPLFINANFFKTAGASIQIW